MADYHVTAWNFVDEQGSPIIEIDEDISRAEYDARVAGKYACVSCSMLRPVSREAIDRAFSSGAGCRAGLDRLPRKVPPEYVRFAETWFAGFDEGDKEYRDFIERYSGPIILPPLSDEAYRRGNEWANVMDAAIEAYFSAETDFDRLYAEAVWRAAGGEGPYHLMSLEERKAEQG